jgi:hypothetical protein
MASTTATAGLGNPLLAMVETAGSLGLTVLACFVPVAAAVLVITLLWAVWRLWRRIRDAA